MKYRVKIKKKVNRGLKKLPKKIQKLLFLLIEDLKAGWPDTKKLAEVFPVRGK
jgi:mRNA-degrading endonuclease RelE of RelBE toxin-antitoxin system